MFSLDLLRMRQTSQTTFPQRSSHDRFIHIYFERVSDFLPDTGRSHNPLHINSEMTALKPLTRLLRPGSAVLYFVSMFLVLVLHLYILINAYGHQLFFPNRHLFIMVFVSGTPCSAFIQNSR